MKNQTFNIKIPCNGFTLIELIFVILIIGIIGVMVAPQWTASGFTLEFQVRGMVDDIRYAQALSMTTGQRYRFVVASANSYQITNESGVAVLLPAGSATATLTNDVVISNVTNLPNNLIAFDSLGAPYTNTVIPGAPLASSAAISLSSGTNTRTVTISPDTGYVSS